LMPLLPRDPIFRLVISALVGSYGLTFIAIAVFVLLAYVLHETRLV